MLGKKKKRTYFEITDEKWETIRKDFSELKNEDKSKVYLDGEKNYIEFKNKKIPLDYKAILKIHKENKNKSNNIPKTTPLKETLPREKIENETSTNLKIAAQPNQQEKQPGNINIDAEIEKEVDKQMQEEESFQQHKQQTKEERIAYLNQLEKEKREMIKRQKLAKKEMQDSSDEDAVY